MLGHDPKVGIKLEFWYPSPLTQVFELEKPTNARLEVRTCSISRQPQRLNGSLIRSYITGIAGYLIWDAVDTSAESDTFAKVSKVLQSCRHQAALPVRSEGKTLPFCDRGGQ